MARPRFPAVFSFFCLLTCGYVQAQSKPLTSITTCNEKDAGKCVNKFGEITVGQPKVWRFERVYSIIDGMLRDLDAATVKSLLNLDGNQTHGFAMDVLQTSFDLQAKFDQTAAVKNSRALAEYDSLHASQIDNLKAWTAANTADNQQMAQLTNDLAAANAARAKLKVGSDDYKAQTDGITDIKDQMNNVKAAQTALGQKPSIDSSTTLTSALTSTSIDPTKSPQPVAPLFNADLFKTLAAASIKPENVSLPATKQLDNFVTLLHERINREFSIVFDDSVRNGMDVYLMQFDFGAYPTSASKDRVAKIEFDIECKNGTDASTGKGYAYELYPGMSSYNITQFYGKSSHTGLVGAASFLAGFGITAQYQRQQDQVRSSMTQSVYVSGFGSGQSRFGWYFGSSPFEHLLTPGIRTTNVMIAVPRGTTKVNLKPRVGWQPKEKQSSDFDTLTAIPVPLPINSKLELLRVAYKPNYTVPLTPEEAKGAALENDSAYVQITTKGYIDPNLVVTVNDKVLPRVRDSRGRATVNAASGADFTSYYSQLPDKDKKDASLGLVNSRFGLLEADKLGPDTWFTAGANTIILNISRKTAGSGFPVIRLLDSGVSGAELTKLVDGDGVQRPELRVGRWQLKEVTKPVCDKNGNLSPPLCVRPEGQVPSSFFLPLFTQAKITKFLVYQDDNAKHDRKALFIERAAQSGSQNNSVLKSSLAQVILKVKSGDAEQNFLEGETIFPLTCSGQEGQLQCKWPVEGIANACRTGNGCSSLLRDSFEVFIETGIGFDGDGMAGVGDRIVEKSLIPFDLPSNWLAPRENINNSRSLLGWDLNILVSRLTDSNFSVSNGSQRLSKCPSTNTVCYSFNPDEGSSGLHVFVPVSELKNYRNTSLYVENSQSLKKQTLPSIFDAISPNIELVASQAPGHWRIHGQRVRGIEKIKLDGCQKNGHACEYPVKSKSLDEILVDIPVEDGDDIYPIVFQFAGVDIDAIQKTGEVLKQWSYQAASLPAESKPSPARGNPQNLGITPASAPIPRVPTVGAVPVGDPASIKKTENYKANDAF